MVLALQAARKLKDVILPKIIDAGALPALQQFFKASAFPEDLRLIARSLNSKLHALPNPMTLAKYDMI